MTHTGLTLLILLNTDVFVFGYWEIVLFFIFFVTQGDDTQTVVFGPGRPYYRAAKTHVCFNSKNRISRGTTENGQQLVS